MVGWSKRPDKAETLSRCFYLPFSALHCIAMPCFALEQKRFGKGLRPYRIALNCPAHRCASLHCSALPLIGKPIGKPLLTYRYAFNCSALQCPSLPCPSLRLNQNDSEVALVMPYPNSF